MFLPHFDRHLSRPPDGKFTLNRNSPQADGLVGWWPSLASRGGSVLRDLVYGNNGAFTGDTNWQSNPEIGAWLDFDGAGDHVQMADRDEYSLNTTGGLTVCAWAAVDTQFTRSVIVSKGAASNYEWALKFENSTNLKVFMWTLAGSNYLTATSSTTYVMGTLYHTAFTAILDTEVRLYENAVEVANDISSSGSYGNGTSVVRIGERGDGQDDLNGRVGGIRIYNRSLYPAEIWQLYAPETRWDLYLPIQRIWPAVAAAAANAPTSHLLGPLYGPLGGPIAA